MNTFIIVAQSLDGFIARESEENSMSWTSKSDKEFFITKTKEAGTIIMGRKTFETIGKPLKNRRIIVMTRDTSLSLEGIEFTNESPIELLNRLKKENVKEVAIAGGASIYSAFLKENLVDKIYITIEPVFFGNGIKILGDQYEHRLNLISSTNIGENTLVLEYNILK